MIKTGHAILINDKNSKANYWLTFAEGDNIGNPFPINEPLVFGTNSYKVGTRIEIFEEVE